MDLLENFYSCNFPPVLILSPHFFHCQRIRLISTSHHHHTPPVNRKALTVVSSFTIHNSHNIKLAYSTNCSRSAVHCSLNLWQQQSDYFWTNFSRSIKSLNQVGKNSNGDPVTQTVEGFIIIIYYLEMNKLTIL